jgi:hypothetical protein
MKKIATSKKQPQKHNFHSNTKPTRPPFKIEIALRLFIERGQQGMNTLEANALFGDTALHSTVSDATNKHGVKFKHQPESVRNRAGSISRFTRYSLLTGSDILRAKKLVNNYRAYRGLSPLVWELSA